MAQTSLPEMPAGPVLELYGQRKRFTVPVGLKCLLEEISREVLRKQPSNIHEFVADYLEEKLKKQCTGGQERRKSWEYRRWLARLETFKSQIILSWDGPSILTDDELLEFLDLFRLTYNEATRIATVIQAAYRGFKGRQIVKEKRASLKQEDNDDLDIEFDGDVTYTVYDCDGRETHFTADDVERILKNYKLSMENANQYAVKIQKTFRGHRTRESFALNFPELAARLEAMETKFQNEPSKEEEEDASTKTSAFSVDVSDDTLHKHATVIQKSFRGFQVRKAHLKSKANKGIRANKEDLGEASEDEFSEVASIEGDEEGQDFAGGPVSQDQGSGNLQALMDPKNFTNEEGKEVQGIELFLSNSETGDEEGETDEETAGEELDLEATGSAEGQPDIDQQEEEDQTETEDENED